MLFMARFIMGEPEGMMVDHKFGDTLNNQKSNLRVCTRANNNKNRKMVKNKTSKYRGVSKKGGGWQASTSDQNAHIYIGYFKTETEAALAYNDYVERSGNEFYIKNAV